jgi:hypothetical protein
MGVDPISHRTYAKPGVPHSSSPALTSARRKANHDHFMALATRAKRAEDKEHYIQKAKAALEESAYEDGDGSETGEDEVTEFYVVFADWDEEAPASVGKIEQSDGKWHETEIWGETPLYWGERGGTYMSYLTPQQIMSWLHKDYKKYDVRGPFDTLEQAQEYAA